MSPFCILNHSFHSNVLNIQLSTQVRKKKSHTTHLNRSGPAVQLKSLSLNCNRIFVYSRSLQLSPSTPLTYAICISIYDKTFEADYAKLKHNCVTRLMSALKEAHLLGFSFFYAEFYLFSFFFFYSMGYQSIINYVCHRHLGIDILLVHMWPFFFLLNFQILVAYISGRKIIRIPWNLRLMGYV